MGNTRASSQKTAAIDLRKERLIKSFLILLYLFSAAYTYHLFAETSQYNHSPVSIVEGENGVFFLPLGFHTFQDGEVSASIVEDQGRKAINVVINPKRAVEYNGFGFNVDMDVPLSSCLVVRLRNNSGEKQIFINVTDNYQGGELFFKAVALKPHSLNEFRIPLEEFQRNEWQPSGASKDGQLNSDGIVIIAFSTAPGSPLDVNLLSLGFEWGISTIYFHTYFALFVFTGLLLLWKKFPEESLRTAINAHSIDYFIYFMCGAIGAYFSNSLVFQTDRYCYIALLSILAVTILDQLLFLKDRFAQIWAFRYIIVLCPVYYMRSDDPGWAIPLFFLTLIAHIPFLVTYRFPLIFLSFLGPLVLIFLKGIGNFHDVVQGVAALIGGSIFSYLFIFFQQNRRDRMEAEHKDQLIKGILETSSDGILLLDTRGNILSSNAGFQKMVLQREEVIAGLNIHDFISIEAQDDFVLNDGKFDLQLKGRDNTPLHVFIRIQNLYTGNNLSGYIATIGDITERKILEERLRKLSIEDNLTGLYNRRYFDLKLEEEWKRANRNQLPLTLLMLDVDNFKLYNDTYGHTKGDMVLQQIANVLVNMTNRSSDKVFRYGGEEFVILLPETSREKLPQFLDSIIRGVESLAIPHEKSLVSSVVTVSIGCKTIIPDKNHEMVELIDTADNALYQAKSEGRNRFIIF